MKIFKTADQKLEELGFTKVEEDEYKVSYSRMLDKCGIQNLGLMYDYYGHTIYSYITVDNKDIYTGLNIYEIKICLKKMKELGWKFKKNKVHIR